MKKRLFLLSLCLLLLCGCSATAATTEEMVELARDKIPGSDAENIQMQAAGRIDTENNTLPVSYTHLPGSSGPTLSGAATNIRPN